VRPFALLLSPFMSATTKCCWQLRSARNLPRTCGSGCFTIHALNCSVSGLGIDKWSERGRMFLSNVRMVLIADRDGPLKAFDAPLVRPRTPYHARHVAIMAACLPSPARRPAL
jgi:hypothetical protein